MFHKLNFNVTYTTKQFVWDNRDPQFDLPTQ